jgi:hypothetical protein
MTTKANFTEDEWKVLGRAPLMAGLVVVAASPSGPIGMIQESLAVGKILSEAREQAGSSELLTALVSDITTPEGRQTPAVSELRGKSPDEIRQYAIDGCRQAVAVLDRKARPEESQTVKRWLHSVGEKVAAAAKEGGFLGIGGTQVSDQEKQALGDLKKTLGIAA